MEASWYCFRAKLRIGKRANDWKNATKAKHGQQSRPGLGWDYDASEININNKYLDVGDLTLNSKDTQIADRFPTGTATGFVFSLGFGSVLGARDQKARDNANNLHTKHTRRIRNIRILNNTSVFGGGSTEACMGLCYFTSDFVLRFVPCQAQPSWICCHYFWQCLLL